MTLQHLDCLQLKIIHQPSKVDLIQPVDLCSTEFRKVNQCNNSMSICNAGWGWEVDVQSQDLSGEEIRAWP